jgi:hypothetical protein
VVPPPALCTDNGAMIAWAGQEVHALLSSSSLCHVAASVERLMQSCCSARICCMLQFAVTKSARRTAHTGMTHRLTTPWKVQRLALGLACPPASVDSLQDVDALHTARGGWLRLRPRWPLTEERHPRAVHRWASKDTPG